MKKGFTILELLVACLLLGMLMTILTMVFSQSSIAWRTGTGGVADLDDARISIAKTRIEADNAYIWEGASDPVLSVLSVWSESGGRGAAKLRGVNGGAAPGRAISVFTDQCTAYERISQINGQLNTSDALTTGAASQDWGVPVTMGGAGSTGSRTYTVNVMSAGPDGQFDTYDDVWSFPDEFDL